MIHQMQPLIYATYYIRKVKWERLTLGLWSEYDAYVLWCKIWMNVTENKYDALDTTNVISSDKIQLLFRKWCTFMRTGIKQMITINAIFNILTFIYQFHFLSDYTTFDQLDQHILTRK